MSMIFHSLSWWFQLGLKTYISYGGSGSFIVLLLQKVPIIRRKLHMKTTLHNHLMVFDKLQHLRNFSQLNKKTVHQSVAMLNEYINDFSIIDVTTHSKPPTALTALSTGNGSSIIQRSTFPPSSIYTRLQKALYIFFIASLQCVPRDGDPKKISLNALSYNICADDCIGDTFIPIHSDLALYGTDIGDCYSLW